MNLNQSLQEVNRIFEEWKNNFAPKDLLLDGKQGEANVNALVEYVTLHFGKVVSITNLNAAVEALPTLARAPKKTALEREVEFRTKELHVANAKRRRMPSHSITRRVCRSRPTRTSAKRKLRRFKAQSTRLLSPTSATVVRIAWTSR
jgi:hypothetical protein